MESKTLLVFAVLLLSLGVYCYAADIEDCGSAVGSIVKVDIAGCGDKARCPLKRNTNATMNIDFKSNVDSSNVTAVVYGIVLGIKTSFALPNPNGCVDSGISCPIKAGETYTYSTTLPVESSYPRVTVTIQWELQTDDGSDLICAKIPAKII
ncbi:unnamed protein product [Phaedon cochleariae]|uniref:MD-2-related lipid-recognition domain-containing protein n=1 Tax=Phaedon cochleariae TaxID=80249 RepID=A0A9P0DIY0_PHACE|nr:unnamed protein product [Phaedon cochleariae]